MAGPMRIAVLGADGRMGRALVRAVDAVSSAAKLTAATERSDSPAIGQDAGIVAAGKALGVPIAPGVPAAGAADVWLDFTVPAATASYAEAAVAAGAALVIGTTGLRPEQHEAIERAAKRVAVVYAANYSIGINVMLKLIKDAAQTLGSAYDPEIVETHHRGKRDAPSGTALRLAEALAEATGRDLATDARYERHGEIGPRPSSQIGIQTLRGGDVVGDHTVYFLGTGDRLEITHRASSRETFAQGAVRAALWLAGRPAGLYDMRSVLGL
jgi:4-hydroxy-tetrahydrodipicolinate reductase